jgi:NAD(P)-dependent dehydrogenase (short-subunit alcohol dehydrogenase family)
LLEGRVAIVTGVGPGMGRAIALRFARHGAAVVLGARQQDRLDEIGEEIRALGGEALRVRCDIVDPGSCAEIVEQTTQRFGLARCRRAERAPRRRLVHGPRRRSR